VHLCIVQRVDPTRNTHSKTFENNSDVGYRVHALRHTITLATGYYCTRKKITAPAPRNPRPGLACTNTLHDPKSPAVHSVRHDQSDRCIRLLAGVAGGGRRGATHAQMVSHRSAIGGLWLVTGPLGDDSPASTDEPVIRVSNWRPSFPVSFCDAIICTKSFISVHRFKFFFFFCLRRQRRDL
jgi:hypothetical protein